MARVQDACCRALEVWRTHGVPENPAGWLMAAAKNRALDLVRRERATRRFSPELERVLETEWTAAVDEAFGPQTIRDEQLRMMFSCCHPRLPEGAQVALILNVLCRFGAAEIASAFLTGRGAHRALPGGDAARRPAARAPALGDPFDPRAGALMCLHAARLHFRAARGRARTEAEQRFLEKRLLACKSA